MNHEEIELIMKEIREALENGDIKKAERLRIIYNLS